MAGYIDNSTDLALFESYSQGRALAGAKLTNLSRFAQWSSLLDSKTCDWCGWADMRVFDTTIEPYDPPMHHGCRCLVAYITKDEFPPKADWGKGPPKKVWPPGSIDKTQTMGLREMGKVPKPRGEIPLLGEDSLDELLTRMTQVYQKVAEDASRFPGTQAGDLTTLTWSRQSGDKLLSEIYKWQGYDGPLAKVGTKAFRELDADDLWRGMVDRSGVAGREGSRFVRELTDGDYFPGFGIFGNGTYSAYGAKGRQVAMQYSGHQASGLLNFKLAKDARVITASKLRRIQDRIRKDLFKLQDSRRSSLERLKSTMSTSEFATAEAELKLWTTNTLVVFEDPGRLAAMMGYDAINVVDANFMIVLNRTKMVIP